MKVTDEMVVKAAAVAPQLTLGTVRQMLEAALSGAAQSQAEPGSEERTITAAVRNIKLDGCASLVLVQGATPSMTVRCGDGEFLPKVLTAISGDMLTIDTEPTVVIQSGSVAQIFKGGSFSIQSNHGLVANTIVNVGGNIRGSVIAGNIGGPLAEVTVMLPHIAGLRIKGAGQVTYHGFTQDEINLDVSGSGNVSLEGAVDCLEAEISGSGEVSAEGLSARKARLRASGSGDIHATVTEAVLARVSGSGKIRIAGNPADRDTDVTGSGKIKFVS